MAATWLPQLIVPVLIAAAVPTLTACDDAPRSLTIAATASMAEPAPSVEPFKRMLKDHALAAGEPGGAAVNVVVSGQPAVEVVDLTPMRNDEVEAVADRAEQLIDDHITTLSAKLAVETAGVAELDALSVLDRAARQTDDGGMVIMLTSGVQTVDPLDLRKYPSWSFDPRTVVSDLDRRELVPDLTGIDVWFYGVGDAFNSQPTLPRPQRMQLQQLWQLICEAGGAASCHVVDTEISLVVPTATRPVSVVPVPVQSTTEASCAATRMTVPDSVLFHADTAILRDGADAVLQRIADQLADCSPRRAKVSVVGHTADVDPGQIDGQDLSDERARVCRDRLVSLGAPADVFTDVYGVADTQPRVDNFVDGAFSETAAALNRRVDIVVDAN